MKLNDKGLLIVLSGPSGVGKGTVRDALFAMKGHNLVYSVSMTTRPPRAGEVHGHDYYFVTREEFEENIRAGKMLEHAEFIGNYYGTPLEAVSENLNAGLEVVLEIEVQGAEQVRQKMPEAVFIFIAPPSLDSLYNRLRRRGTESEEVIRQRIEKAKREINLAYKYDYIVVNDTVENAADKILAIIRSEHASVKRVLKNYKKMLGVE
ncbi:MAG: guanylate kinase [Bacilli bacterium]|jgi:guanylate kinase|nr:guanylate kinase [Bacilli bacterium]HPZ26850.1 guanylate kinase [Bacilli bacterium]HQC89151.1 guanylate kinase [Bacilli bacterium]